ncbi:phage tail protein [Shinella sp.]|uniref:phage tail protein n=1 Tax=Shinella sp. TaxID=1870904 RepID=UPI0039E67EF9
MTSLAPNNANIYERANEAALAPRWDTLWQAVPYVTTMKDNPPPAALPFLIYEFGLGMLTPYVPNLYELLDGRGIRWMRLRGTYEGVERGLAFLGITATVEAQWHGRAWWNSSQLRFPVLPPSDNPLLERIEGITRLSLPMRSDLRRGVHQYDVGPLIGNVSQLNESLLDRESGIALKPGGTLWSFGRTTEIEHTLTEAEGTAIGNWIDEPEDGGIPWIAMTYPWVTATFPWSASPAAQRRALMAAWFPARPIYARLKDAAGGVIGYRRCRACHAVSQVVSGRYTLAGQSWSPASAGQVAYIEAMTDFGDADGVTARSVALVAGVTLAAGVPPGRLWLKPNDVTAGTPFAETPISLPLRKTVRERFKFLVRF